MSLDELKNTTIVIGAKQVRKAISQGMTDKVFIADDAEPHVVEPIKELCRQNNIAIQFIDTKAALGRYCGIEVGSATAAVLND